ncbi:MAG: hypothetical protein ACK4NC_07160 [Candidatus Gracilibacteria bacterium]
MAFWQRSKPFFVDKPIVAFPQNVSAPFSVTLNAVDFGLNYTDFPEEPSKKSYPGGHFIVKETVTVSSSTNTYYRFLPAAKITAIQRAAYTSGGGGNTFTPSPIKVTVERTYPFTLTRDENKPFAIVNFLGGNLYEKYTLADCLELTAINYSTGELTFREVYEGLNVFTGQSAGNALTLSGASVQNYYLIRQDYLRRVLVRPAPSSITGNDAVPYYQYELLTQNILGVHEHALDFTDAPTLDVAVITKAAGVYAQNLPYKDPELLYAFQQSLNPRESF